MKLGLITQRWQLILTGMILCAALFVALYFFHSHNGDFSINTVVSNEQQKIAAPNAEPSGKRLAEKAPSQLTERATIPVPPVHSKVLHTLDRDLVALAKDYAALAEKANNGDANAALELYEGIKLCVGVPVTEQAMQDYRDQLATDYKLDSPQYARSLSFMTRQYQGCSQFSTEQLGSYKNWLATAAKLGNDDAKVKFILEGPPNNPDSYYRDVREYQADAERYINEELSAGNAEALFAASVGYGKDGSLNPDPVKQYAYLYAYVLAKNNTQGVINDWLQKLGGLLSPSDLSAASTQGENIYRSCCAH